MKRPFLINLLFGLSLFVGIALQLGAEEKPKKVEEPKKAAVQNVELVVDYGDGAQKRFPKVPIGVKEQTTVLEVLVWASKHPHGIELKHRGKGALALVSQIDDLKNKGGKGNNWIFRVNDKLGTRSCGAHPLEPGDKVLWKFDEYR